MESIAINTAYYTPL